MGELNGGRRPDFDEVTYLSERGSAYKNLALSYLMMEGSVFPDGSDALDSLDLYFRCCALRSNVVAMASLGAMLANGGVCVSTGRRVASAPAVRACLSMMASCGMYDYSGEFSFSVGIPAKSAVSGCVLAVAPNRFGLCVFSPRLDGHGNSVRGVQVCRELSARLNLHAFDGLGAPVRSASENHG